MAEAQAGLAVMDADRASWKGFVLAYSLRQRAGTYDFGEGGRAAAKLSRRFRVQWVDEFGLPADRKCGSAAVGAGDCFEIDGDTAREAFRRVRAHPARGTVWQSGRIDRKEGPGSITGLRREQSSDR